MNKTSRINDTFSGTRFAHRSKRGASLVEVMVVLVVLLLGIFLAIRIFPEGFGVLRANGNRTLATRLAEQEMSSLRGDLANLPDGVLFSIPSATGMVFVTNQEPDNLEQFNPNPAPNSPDPPFNPYFTDVNKFRYIKGETVKIPLPTATSFGTGSVYVCKFGPLFMNNIVGNPSNAPNAGSRTLFDSFLAVNGAPLTGNAVDADTANPFRYRGFLTSQQIYLIDYGTDNDPAQIMFAPRPPTTPARANPERNFRVTFSYEDGSGAILTQTTNITVPDSNSPIWQALPVGDVISGSDVVVRAFERIAVGAAWDVNDPYQYKLLSDNIDTGEVFDPTNPTVETTYANMGVLAFNPAGANYSETTVNGVRAFTAHVDYNVLDWHILREDREVPSLLTGPGNTVPVRVTLRDLKRLGDPEANNTFYNGLYGAGKQVDIEVFDLNETNGEPLLPGDYNAGSPQDVDPFTGNNLGRPADYYIEKDNRNGSYRTGTIYVNTARRPAGSKLRILYKAQGDWAVTVQKAYSRYIDANAAVPASNSYNQFGRAGVGVNARLVFPLTDLNKSFVVTIEYVDPTSGEVKRLAPVQMTADVRDGDYAIVDVPKFLPRQDVGNPDPARGPDGPFDNATGWRVHGTIQGVSVKTRVIWRDSDSPTQRWRVEDMDTYLTPKQEGVF